MARRRLSDGQHLVRRPLPRKEDPTLLTGRGRFVDDIHLPHTLHAAFVRSQHAHARIIGIDIDAARAVEGCIWC